MPSKIQLDENLVFLYICLQKSDMKTIDFAAVGATTNLKPPAARMRYTRLKRQIEKGVIGSNANMNLGGGSGGGEEREREDIRGKEERKERKEKEKRERREKKEKKAVKEMKEEVERMRSEGLGVEKKEVKRKREDLNVDGNADADADAEADVDNELQRIPSNSNITGYENRFNTNKYMNTSFPQGEGNEPHYLHFQPRYEHRFEQEDQTPSTLTSTISTTHEQAAEPPIKLEPRPFSSFSSLSSDPSAFGANSEDRDSEDEMPLAKRRGKPDVQCSPDNEHEYLARDLTGIEEGNASQRIEMDAGENYMLAPIANCIVYGNDIQKHTMYDSAHLDPGRRFTSFTSPLTHSSSSSSPADHHPVLPPQTRLMSAIVPADNYSHSHSNAHPHPHPHPHSISASTTSSPIPVSFPHLHPHPPQQPAHSQTILPPIYNWNDQYQSYRHLWGTERVAKDSPPPPPLSPSSPMPNIPTSNTSSTYSAHTPLYSSSPIPIPIPPNPSTANSRDRSREYDYRKRKEEIQGARR